MWTRAPMEPLSFQMALILQDHYFKLTGRHMRPGAWISQTQGRRTELSSTARRGNQLSGIQCQVYLPVSTSIKVNQHGKLSAQRDISALFPNAFFCTYVGKIDSNMVNLWFFLIWSLRDFPSNEKAWPPGTKDIHSVSRKCIVWRKMNWGLSEKGPTIEDNFSPRTMQSPEDKASESLKVWRPWETEAWPFEDYVNIIPMPVKSPLTSRPTLSVMGWILSPKEKICWSSNPYASEYDLI